MENKYTKTTVKEAPFLTLDRVLLYSIIGGTVFSKADLLPTQLPGVSVTDVIVIVTLAFMVISTFMTKLRLRYDVSMIYMFLLWLWALGSALFLGNVSPFEFSINEHFRSFLKLSLYITACVFLISYLRTIPRDEIRNAVMNILVLNGLIAIYIFVVMTFELDLPYKFLWYGHKEAYFGNCYYRNTGLVVAKGIFSEPSTLGIFQNLGIAYVFLSPSYNRSNVKVEKCKLLLVIIPILLTLSLTTYLLLMLNFTLFFLKYKASRLKVMVFALTVGCIAFGVASFTGFYKDVMKKRLTNVFHWGDSSSVTRIAGTWEIPLKIVNECPVFGAGLGNIGVASLDRSFHEVKCFECIGNDPWNILAYFLGSLGVVGFCLFMILIGFLLIRNPFTGLVFLAYMFATGAVLEYTFWLFYALFRSGPAGAKWTWFANVLTPSVKTV